MQFQKTYDILTDILKDEGLVQTGLSCLFKLNKGCEINMAKSKGGNTVDAVTETVAPIIEALGLALWDVRFEKEGSEWYLRIFIDADRPITLDDCEAVSRAIDAPLDEADPVEQSYFLEVSSPGLNRDLRKEAHFMAFIEKEISVKTIRPMDGERDFEGILKGFSNNEIEVEVGEVIKKFGVADCSSIKTKDI